MARGILKQDYEYEVEGVDAETGVVTPVATLLLRLDKFNIGTTNSTIKESSITEALLRIKAHIKLNKNKTEYGIHPRHVVLELASNPNVAACYGFTPKRRVELPILTLSQFQDLEVFDKLGGAVQPNTSMLVNHSFDGSTKIEYKIIAKINEVKI